MSTVAVVGLGAMGSRIAQRLLSAGHEVIVWNRTQAKAAELAGLGAVPVKSPAEAARWAEVLITMVADPAALRAVSEGDDGIATGADASLTVVAMATVGPSGLERLSAVLPPGTALLDAPVLGSIGEAETGSLSIFAGGPVEVVERVAPLLSVLGSVLHVGPLGTGQAAKLVANATLFGALASLGEAVALGRGLGLSHEALFDVLATTPLAAQAERRRDAIERGEYPRRFPVSLARKDAELIRAAATASGVELRLLEAARTWLADTETAGGGDRDYSAVLGTVLGRSESEEPAARPPDYDGLIVDLDGVVWLGRDPIEGAAEAIARARDRGTRVLFLTNDPQCSRDEHAARLTEIGIPATAADILTSAAATARLLGARDDLRARNVLVVGSRALRDEIEAAGFNLVPHADARGAEIVVLGGHDGFDYAELLAATRALAAGAVLFATGRDRVVPTCDGPLPGTGAILAAVETASGVTATVVGKPEPYVFELARELLPGCDRIAVVGDNLASDVAGAKRAGLDAILVLTGATTRDDLERTPIRPDFVLSSLADMAPQ